jgi:hypothetical protein
MPMQPRSILSLSLFELETVMAVAKKNQTIDIDLNFNLASGAYEIFEKAYAKVALRPTRKESKSFRHIRPRVYGSDNCVYRGRVVERIITIPHPASEAERKIAQSIFLAVQKRLFSSDFFQETRHALIFFFRNHRAGDGHVWLKSTKDSVVFVQWVLKNIRDCNVYIEVTPSFFSELSPSEQVSEWRRLIGVAPQRVIISAGEPGKRYKYPLGTATLKFQAPQPDKAKNRGYTVRYALVMLCMLALAKQLASD